MKEVIEFNYNISLDSINEDNEICSFIYHENLYIFSKFTRNENDIEDIIKCSQELFQKNIISHQVMLNKESKHLTKYEEENYILLKINKNYNAEIDIFDIIKINSKTILNENQKKNYKNNWDDLWGKKLDYFEFQIKELGKDNKIILDTFSYYIGLAENAISVCSKYNKLNNYGINENVVLSHRRIFYPNIILNFHNPISYLFDLNIRDLAEYIKSSFFAGEDIFMEISSVLRISAFSHYTLNMLFARLLYPSYYFDIYEDIILGVSKENSLIKIIEKQSEFEEYIKKIYFELSKYTVIEKIDWLIR